MADDYRDTYNDTSEALGSASPGGSTTGIIDTDGDIDIFAVSLVAGRTYTLDLKGFAGGGGTLADPYMILRDAAGSYLTASFDANGTPDSQLVYTATRTGIFYVGAQSQPGSGMGSYTLSVDAGFVDDFRDVYNDTNEALGSLTPGGSTTGNVEIVGDRDVFAISLVAGRTYTFDLRGFATGGGSLGDPYLELRDAAGGYISASFDANGTPDSQIVFTATASGTYYLSAGGQASNGTGTYTLSASSGLVDDYRDVYNDTNEALGAVAPGGSSTGTIELDGDDDVFAITLVAGRTYTFDLTGATGGGGTLADPYLELRDAVGGYIASAFDSNGTPNPQIVYTATANGTYYLTASGQQATGTGTYTLSASSGFVDDYRDVYNDTNEALGTLNPGGSRTGTIESAGDVDVFRIALTAGTSYIFNLRGAPSGQGTLPDTYLEIRDATGAYLTGNFDYNGSPDSRFAFTATESGYYYLYAKSQTAGGTGTYRLTASAGVASGDDFGDTITDTAPNPGLLAINASRTGIIEDAGDRDVFRVDLVAGRTYTFDLARDGLADPQLRLMNSAGGTILSNDNFNSANSRIVFTPSTSGAYYLEARSHTASGTGSYTIQARTGFDDYADSLSDTASPLGLLPSNTSRFGNIESNGDRDVFAIELVAGRSYTFELMGSGNGGIALPDALLRLLDGSGVLIAGNDDFNGPNARIVFRPTVSGTYYLDARNDGPGIGTYEIVARVNYDDFADSISDTASPMGAVGIDGVTWGTIETVGDRDVFAVDLIAGRSYTIDLAGSALAGAALADGALRLFNASGTVLRANGDFNSSDSRIVFTPNASGTYYVEARSEASGGTGTYSVSVKQGFDDRADSIWDPTSPLGVLGTVARLGTIETPGDSDVWKVSLVAGRRYAFDLKAMDISGGLSNPDLQLTDANGTILAYDDNAGEGLNARIVFTASESGVYYLNARGVGALYGTYEIGMRALAARTTSSASTETGHVMSSAGEGAHADIAFAPHDVAHLGASMAGGLGLMGHTDFAWA